MPSRIQQLVMGVSKGKQTSISTPQTTFLRLRKLNADVTSPSPHFENDASEIGKGHEFTTQTFPSHYDVANRIEKYASSEFTLWAVGMALGNVVQVGTSAPYTYTIVPIDPGTTLELPYFTVVEQVAEGGGMAIDNAFVGCAMEEFTYSFNYGPGRASSRLNCSWSGSGIITSPSGVSMPSLITENNMLAAGMSLVVNGVDYVSTKRILSGSIGWKNNLNLNAGFYPGSGVQNGLQTRGRMEIGSRVPSFQFTTRLLAGSPEYNTLINQTTGTAVLTIQHDASNAVTFTFPQMAFQMVETTDADGLVALNITGAPEFSSTANTVLSVTGTCGISGLAQ